MSWAARCGRRRRRPCGACRDSRRGRRAPCPRGRSTARCRRPTRSALSAATSVSAAWSAASSSSPSTAWPLAEADLRQARAGAHDDREGARADLETERPLIAGRDLVELLAAIGHHAGEDVETAGRALRVGRGRRPRRAAPGSPAAARCRRSRSRAPRRRRGRSRAASAGRACPPRDARARAGSWRARGRPSAPSRRSRLAGWIWSASSGAGGGQRPRLEQRRRSRGRQECPSVVAMVRFPSGLIHCSNARRLTQARRRTKGSLIPW